MTAATPWSRLAPLVLLAGLIISGRELRRRYPISYPPFERLLVERNGIQDPALIVAGFRAFAADVAWVQMLAYVGGARMPDENPARSHDLLKFYALRVVRIDPFYLQAYSTSAAILAWIRGIERPDEAMEILQEGIRNNPTYWPLRLYAAAIGFKKSGQYEKMTELLEQAVREPDCPILLIAVLGNAYRTHGRYADALRVWRLYVADPKSEGDRARGEKAVAELEQLVKQGGRK